MNNTPRFCENCGAPLTQGVNFCEECGHPVETQPVQLGEELQTFDEKDEERQRKERGIQNIQEDVPLRRLRKQREKDAQVQRAKEEQELQRMKEVTQRQEKESQRKAKEIEEQGLRLEKEEKSSGGRKWFIGVIIIFVVLALGWYGTQDSNSPATPQKTTPYMTTTPVTSAKATPPAAAVVTSSSDQKTIINSIGMDFVLIPAGEFNMGSPSSDPQGFDSERPVHRVKISNAFYMGKYEVTQKQWRDVMGTSPSNFKGDNLPVESVSWNDVQDFTKKLNEKEGGNKYRLPSEAEWEYAARAGTTTHYSFGDEESELGDYAWYMENSEEKTHDVGQKKPNPWGLYDMHGNVDEWVQDVWHDSYNGAPIDGSAWEGSGSYRVNRGGYRINNARYCRSAIRDYRVPGNSLSDIGFRLLRIL
jgi:formylglycine-generating enzyme required for sulfatase activity